MNGTFIFLKKVTILEKLPPKFTNSNIIKSYEIKLGLGREWPVLPNSPMSFASIIENFKDIFPISLLLSSHHCKVFFLAFFFGCFQYLCFPLEIFGETTLLKISFCQIGVAVEQMGAEAQFPRSLINRIYAPLADDIHFATPISSFRTSELELVCFSLSILSIL